MALTDDMIKELNTLKDREGNIKTEDLVELARIKTSALHKHPAFEWDLDKAARAQWMDAARGIILSEAGTAKSSLA